MNATLINEEEKLCTWSLRTRNIMVVYVGPSGFFEVGGLDLSSGTAFQPLKEVMVKALV